MNEEIAEQIANLINERNKLTVHYSTRTVLEAADNYIYKVDNGKVIGSVEVRRVQWYQSEIDHLSVQAFCEGRGIGTELLKEAEAKAIRSGARISQCTIREGNEASCALFQKHGYTATVTFRNRDSGNLVTVYQKVLGAE